MDEQRQNDQLESTHNSSVSIQDIALKTYWKRWPIEKGNGKRSGRSVLIARHDVDECFKLLYLLIIVLGTMSCSPKSKFDYVLAV